MKSTLVVAIFVLLAVSMQSCDAATASGVFKNPEHPGKCYINADLILSDGQEAKDPNTICGRIICGKMSVADFQTCGAVLPPPDCQLGDYQKPDLDYPECCRRDIICPE